MRIDGSFGRACRNTASSSAGAKERATSRSIRSEQVVALVVEKKPPSRWLLTSVPVLGRRCTWSSPKRMSASPSRHRMNTSPSSPSRIRLRVRVRLQGATAVFEMTICGRGKTLMSAAKASLSGVLTSTRAMRSANSSRHASHRVCGIQLSVDNTIGLSLGDGGVRSSMTAPKPPAGQLT
jgi:hypothetical protein